MYSFDTSVFMDWQARYYPPDIFSSLVTRIEELIGTGQGKGIGSDLLIDIPASLRQRQCD